MSNLTKTGAFALLDSLVRNGTQHIFGYPGGAILPLYDELYLWEEQNLVQHILARHEQGAIHAADAYARTTGKVGVCWATYKLKHWAKARANTSGCANRSSVS